MRPSGYESLSGCQWPAFEFLVARNEQVAPAPDICAGHSEGRGPDHFRTCSVTIVKIAFLAQTESDRPISRSVILTSTLTISKRQSGSIKLLRRYPVRIIADDKYEGQRVSG
jgi:hypothetical protein